MSMLSESDGELSASPELVAVIQAQRAVIEAQRQELVRWRDCGRLPDESLRLLQRELDLEERALPGG
jgi:CPA1 family monovalent cation:H+ antiporter